MACLWKVEKIEETKDNLVFYTMCKPNDPITIQKDEFKELEYCPYCGHNIIEWK